MSSAFHSIVWEWQAAITMNWSYLDTSILLFYCFPKQQYRYIHKFNILLNLDRITSVQLTCHVFFFSCWLAINCSCAATHLASIVAFCRSFAFFLSFPSWSAIRVCFENLFPRVSTPLWYHLAALYMPLCCLEMLFAYYNLVPWTEEPFC